MQTGPAKAGQDLKLEAFDITGLKVDVGQLGHGFGWFWKLLRCKDVGSRLVSLSDHAPLQNGHLKLMSGGGSFFAARHETRMVTKLTHDWHQWYKIPWLEVPLLKKRSTLSFVRVCLVVSICCCVL